MARPTRAHCLAPPEALAIEYRDDHQHAADHAGLARPEAHRGRRPGQQGIYVHVVEVGPEKIVFTHAAILKHMLWREEVLQLQITLRRLPEC